MGDSTAAGWLTLTAYAERAGVNKSTISRQLGKVIPETALRRARGVIYIDATAADAARQQQLNPLLRRHDGPNAVRAVPETGDESDAATDLHAADGEPPARPAGGQGNLLQSPAFHQGRAAKEMWSAAKTQLEVQEKRGLLLDKAEVFDAFVTIGVAVRDRLENRRRMLSRKIMGIADPNEIAAILDAEDRALLDDMAKEFEELTGVAVVPAAPPASDAA